MNEAYWQIAERYGFRWISFDQVLHDYGKKKVLEIFDAGLADLRIVGRDTLGGFLPAHLAHTQFRLFI